MKRYKRFIFSVIALVLLIAGFLWARGQYVVPIIMYHNVDNNSEISCLSVSPASFERQMRFLKDNGYNVVRLEDLPDIMKKEEARGKTIAITFDDGFENNYTSAYPVLKKLGLPATIFIVPGFIGRKDYLTWDQVIEMSESGVISIGSHSMNHAYLSGFTGEDLEMEIAGSKRVIENHIGKNIYSFSYPIGAFNDEAKDSVKRAGYKIAVATNPGKKYPKHDLLAMKRLRISKTSDRLLVFWIETSGFYTWIKEHRDED
ncbi:MAG: polysaccharide deacetylase family protein [Candidatus Omnitrophica bacterium]|nr:polysaccharide deacetylase family protein [Candidatus Omnitrophota bacterium]